nr:immunoglobulin light chain junction region [Macaca mulatta]
CGADHGTGSSFVCVF